MNISGAYSPTKWVETTYGEILDGNKTTKVSAEFQFSGGVEGVGDVEYLMSYSSFDEEDLHAATANYVGQIKVTGRVKGKQGSFVLHDRGRYDSGVAKSEIEIVTDSGTGELVSISGHGFYLADANGCSWELNYELNGK